MRNITKEVLESLSVVWNYLSQETQSKVVSDLFGNHDEYQAASNLFRSNNRNITFNLDDGSLRLEGAKFSIKLQDKSEGDSFDPNSWIGSSSKQFKTLN